MRLLFVAALCHSVFAFVPVHRVHQSAAETEQAPMTLVLVSVDVVKGLTYFEPDEFTSLLREVTGHTVRRHPTGYDYGGGLRNSTPASVPTAIFSVVQKLRPHWWTVVGTPDCPQLSRWGDPGNCVVYLVCHRGRRCLGK